MTHDTESERAKFEAWHVNFYKEPLPREWRIVDVWQCWQAAHEQGRLSGLEEAAKVCEAEYQRIMALQKPGAYGSTEEAVNTNLRMIAVMLPECASAIRALAASDGGK
jgi:hypothetical protein